MKIRFAYWFFAIAVTFVFSSCAMLLNEKTQNLHIHCDSNLKLVRVEKAIKLYTYKSVLNILNHDSIATYVVTRSRKPLLLEFKLKDSSLVKYNMKAGLSRAYIFGNLYPIFPLGHLIDLASQKRFAYSRENYFSYSHVKNKIIRSSLSPLEKKTLEIRIGWSFWNSYQQGLANQLPGRNSPLGLNLQIGYFLRSHHSLYAEAGFASMLVPRSPYQTRRYSYAGYDSIVNNYCVNYWLIAGYKYHAGRFAAGAGLEFFPLYQTDQRYYVSSWDTIYKGDTVTRKYYMITGDKLKNDHLFKAGVSFNVSFQITNRSALGMNWHLLLTDLNKNNGFYASHFFNFYITFRVAGFNFKPRENKHKHD